MVQTTRKLGWKSLPIGATIKEAGSSVNYKTGDWRAFRPLLDEKKCINCLTCWIFCPEPAITRKEKTVEIDYDYCKGCGICATECPVKAIKMEEEMKG